MCFLQLLASLLFCILSCESCPEWENMLLFCLPSRQLVCKGLVSWQGCKAEASRRTVTELLVETKKSSSLTHVNHFCCDAGTFTPVTKCFNTSVERRTKFLSWLFHLISGLIMANGLTLLIQSLKVCLRRSVTLKLLLAANISDGFTPMMLLCAEFRFIFCCILFFVLLLAFKLVLLWCLSWVWHNFPRKLMRAAELVDFLLPYALIFSFLTFQQVVSAVRAGVNPSGNLSNQTSLWDLSSSFFFSGTVITTIGKDTAVPGRPPAQISTLLRSTFTWQCWLL